MDEFAGRAGGRHSKAPGRGPWARVAPYYDRQLGLESSALAAAAELLGGVATDRLLDLGTGTAAFLRRLAATDGRPALAVGLDCERAMLRHAGQVPKRWPFVLGAADALPFADRSFDAVSACYLLHVLEPRTRAQALGEVCRVLTQAGRLLTITPVRPRSRAGRALMAPFVAASRRWPDWLPGLEPYDPRPLLERHGFAIEASRRTGRGYPSLVLLARRAHVVPGASQP